MALAKERQLMNDLHLLIGYSEKKTAE